MFGAGEPGVNGHTLRCDILWANPGNEGAAGNVLSGPAGDRGDRLGG